MKSLVEYKISTGPLGFRKANRGEYEAGFQTASQCLKEMAEIVKRSSNNKYNGSLVPIDIRMKEFGKGRSAFIAALNGKEGNRVRSLVRQISDCTALKFGGVRSPGQRRL